jgi:hypothetical protein
VAALVRCCSVYTTITPSMKAADTIMSRPEANKGQESGFRESRPITWRFESGPRAAPLT